MAISYPRSMPYENFAAVNFELVRFGSTNYLYGGATQYREVANARWRGSWTTKSYARTSTAHRLERAAWEAWLDTLRGGSKRFLGYDAWRKHPVGYPGGSGLGAWGGTASVTAVSAFALSFSGVASGMTVRPGDLVGLVQSSKYSLHTIVEQKTASGTTLSGVAVEPAINTTLFTTSATANFIAPKCEMMLIPNSVDIAREGPASAISFSAMQVLY